VFAFASTVNTAASGTTGNKSYTLTPWDQTLGWLLGFRSNTSFVLSPNSLDTSSYQKTNNYVYDISTNRAYLTGDTTVNVYLFNQFYIILDDYTQNHLNDGLVTVAKAATDIALPDYSVPPSFQLDPTTTQAVVSLNDATQAGANITQRQQYSSTRLKSNANFRPKIYSSPPYVKDMFALIPMKLNGLYPGQSYVELGGALQDNDRKYFGPVNIRRISLRLISDHGAVVDLNGANWSVGIVCEYLYTSTAQKKN
jgi:hypothetical protein